MELYISGPNAKTVSPTPRRKVDDIIVDVDVVRIKPSQVGFSRLCCERPRDSKYVFVHRRHVFCTGSTYYFFKHLKI